MAAVSACGAKAILVDELLRQPEPASLISAWAETESVSLVLATAETLEGLLDKDLRIVLLQANGPLETDEALRRLLTLVRLHSPATPVVILSDGQNPKNVRIASSAGFNGYVPTTLDPPLAFKALSLVLAGGSWFPPQPFLEPDKVSPEATANAGCPAPAPTLTSRQQEIVEGLKQGDANKVIARKLNISEATVKIHVRQIMRKLGVRNRTQVALRASASRDNAEQDG